MDLTFIFIGITCIVVGMTLGIKYDLWWLNIVFCMLGGNLLARAFTG